MERAVFSMTESVQKVIVGVDTHKDFHHAAIITALGEPVDNRRFAATAVGYEELIGWVTAAGSVIRVGVEGTGSYGAGLARRLRLAGMVVVDVIAPDRQERRLRGKTDQLDAFSAARAVLASRARTVPKTRDGQVEALRVLRTTRKMLVKQRTETINQLHSLLVSAPEPVKAKLVGLGAFKLATACSRTRHATGDDVLTTVTKDALRRLGRRYLELRAETKLLEKQISALATDYAPELMTLHGVGPDTAAALLTVAGENADRLTSESALAHLTGVAPIPASSGRTNRHRLNRGGNRQGNAALHRIVLVRMKSHQPTHDYIAKTLARGKTKKDAMRLLKRYVAREVFPVLIAIQQRHQTHTTAA